MGEKGRGRNRKKGHREKRVRREEGRREGDGEKGFKLFAQKGL